jgi:hypothetical protein
MDKPEMSRSALGVDENVYALIRVCLDREGAATAELAREENAVFDAAALAVAQRWRFKPYVRNGTARAACAIAEFSHSFAESTQFAALPRARFELPDAIEEPVALPRGFLGRPPTPGVAFARICREVGTRRAPRFTLLQSSGDPAFDRAIFDEPVTVSEHEDVAPHEECWLRHGIAGVHQPFDYKHAWIRYNVMPTVLEAGRISGDKAILPPDRTKYEIAAAGVTEVKVPVKICIDSTGMPVEVKVMRSSDFFAYDMEIINGVASWRYRPVPTPICSAIQFIYRQKQARPRPRVDPHLLRN